MVLDYDSVRDLLISLEENLTLSNYLFIEKGTLPEYEIETVI